MEEHAIHETLTAVFEKDAAVVETGFGTMKLLSGLNGQGTLYLTPGQAKHLADVIYKQLGLTPSSV